jgi:2-oxoglutarate dehydrogenase E2 component (dihydrolipoamide succinyltransferase)
MNKMKKNIEVPSVGESITSGVIVSWLASDGQQVKEGDIIFELETDKATLEIPAPGAGTLEILIKEDTEVAIGQTVGTLSSGEEAAKPATPTPEEPPAVSLPPTPPATPAVAPAQNTDAEKRRTETVPMTTIRKRTAKRLLQATQSSAYLTTFNEIDMEKLVDIRTQYKEQFQKEHGIKIGFMSFFVKACCQALKEFPAVNTQVDEQAIVYKYFYDIGVAISIEDGLIVPVIRDADTMHFADIEAAIVDIVKRAKEKKLMPDELTGGTFTITNGGVFGSLLSTPIPAYPQAAILGMHAIKKRPVVIDDQIAIRPMMYVALTYDHRVIDGRDAIGFLSRVKDFIEDTDKLLLEL